MLGWGEECLAEEIGGGVAEGFADVAVAFDCDADTLLIKVEQKGGACHEGYRSCFFREVSPDGNSTRIVGKKVFDPNAVYS